MFIAYWESRGHFGAHMGEREMAWAQSTCSKHGLLQGRQALGRGRLNSHASHPSSSSLLDGAGRGAPAFSVVGRLIYPLLPNGLSDRSDDMKPFWGAVLTGTSTSRRDQPKELIESRKDADAILNDKSCTQEKGRFAEELRHDAAVLDAGEEGGSGKEYLF